VNWIDLLSLAVLAVFFIAGLVKGLIREIMTLAGVIVSFLAALHLAGLAAPWIEKWVVLPSRISLFVGFLLVFVALLVVFHILGYVIYRVVRATPLTFLDRLAGGIFGLCKASLIIFLVLLVISLVPMSRSAASRLSDSYAFRTARWAAPIFARYLRAAAPAFLRVMRGSEKKSTESQPAPPPGIAGSACGYRADLVL
jgi:membrane protein required for colicin V production